MKDIKRSVLRRAGEVVDGSSSYDAIAEEYINNVFFSILSGSSEFELDLGERWQWAKNKNPGTLVLQPVYASGSVSLTAGSASGTFSIAPAASQVNRYLKIDGRQEVFRITAHTAGASPFTIECAYTDTTGAALSFKSIPLEYELDTTVLRLIDGFTVYKAQNLFEDREFKIYETDLYSLNRDFPLTLIDQGIPTRFAKVFEDDGKITIRFNKYVDVTTKLDYDFIAFPNDLRVKTFADTDVTVGTDLITIASHGFRDGDAVQFENADGALPTGLSIETTYFVVSSASGTFKVSASRGGTAVDITAASGGGTHTVSTVPILPREHRVCLEYPAVYWIMVDKSDDRAGAYMQLAQIKLKSLIEANNKEMTQTGKNKGRLIPRPEQTKEKRVFTANPGN
jgi:hypothetical protein